MFLLKNNKKNIDLSINDHSINPFIASNLSPGHFWQLSKINRHCYLQLSKQIHNSAVVERWSHKQTVPGSNPG